MAQIVEYFKLALRNLKSRRLRSSLTILGIVIGVFLIITLLSLSQGLKITLQKHLRTLGGEMIFVIPGQLSNPMAMFMSGAKLENQDLKAIEFTYGVDVVLPMSYQSLVVRHKQESEMILISGLPLKKGLDVLKQYQGWSLKKGDFPKPGRKEIVIGSLVEKEIFKNLVRVGDDLIIKGRKFRAVGVLNSLGSKIDDSSIFMDTSFYQNLTGEKRNTANMALVKIKDGYKVDEVAQRIKENLQRTRKRRIGTSSADFSVVTSQKMGEIAGNILSLVQIIVLAFASIAILVGGIGIANTMFTSVRERTREIGIMKAVGAKNSAILIIFLIEAGIIGLVGGAGGTILGVIAAKLIETYGQVHPLFYFHASLGPSLILFGLTFSLAIGCLAGFLPARRAAKLKPAQALRRYE